jgi:hypothetical protein
MMTSVGVGRLAAIEQQFDDRHAGRGIEIAGRLVSEDDRRARRNGAGDRHALLLTAGKLGRIMIDPMRQANCAQFLASHRKGVAIRRQLKRHGDILQCGHVGSR